MKKHLLFVASALFSFASFSQFTQNNEPQDGNGATLFVIDSNAVSYEAVTGVGVTWDYSAVLGYGNAARTLTALNPSATPEAGTYPNATVAVVTQDFLVNYFSSTSSERVSHGFVFSEPTVGDIVAVYDAPVLNFEYPMAVGDDLAASFSGDIFSDLGNGDFSGSLTATVDGSGTLILAENSYTNVLRYKLEETVNAELDLGIFPVPITLNRKQFEYYDHTVSNLPIFTHTDVTITSALFNQAFTLVMSLEDPAGTVSTNNFELANVKVYPNPTSDFLQVELPEGMENTTIQILDVSGKVVLAQEANKSLSTIAVNKLTAGTYIVNIQNDSQRITRNIVIK
ncbi:MAG: T9SS type A sorting domain-containing protein [Crocinitomicaceae bacterium]|nr:T9SS type A sorting domain-containing protein [Crocinitomicaceae bacterium]